MTQASSWGKKEKQEGVLGSQMFSLNKEALLYPLQTLG